MTLKRILSIQSNVVYGYAGNKASVFPMQRLGIDVLPINTVQLSSNTVYPGYGGSVMAPGHITSIINSLDKIGLLATIDAVISGYIGTAAQGDEILDAVTRIRAQNPAMIYVCDPVMGGDIDKGCAVSPDIVTFFKERATQQADYICPNLVELQILAQRQIHDFSEVLEALHDVQTTQCDRIIVKNLLHASRDPNQFEMIFTTANERWHLARPFYDFAHRPLGVGDLICGVFTAQLVNEQSPLAAFEFAGNVANEVLKKTYQLGSRELELIQAQDQIRSPRLDYQAINL